MDEKELKSLVHDERRCVTIQSVALRNGGCRTTAVNLLMHHDTAANRFVVETNKEEVKNVPCTVFRLCKQQASTTNTTAPVVAIQDPASTETLTAAHERDMVQAREDRSTTMTTTSTLLIPPPPEILALLKKSDNNDDDDDPMEIDDTTPVQQQDALQHRRPVKTTTAAQFFNKHGKENKKRVIQKKSTTTTSKPPAVTESKASAKPMKQQQKKKPTKKTVGRVEDEFVGDEDSDTDSVVVSSAPAPEPMDVDEEDTKPVKVAGKVKTTSSAPSHERPRRKVLKKETYQDAKGYMQTRNIQVWEDIPSDEEVKTIAVVKKPAPKKKTKVQTKQTSLAGFFKAK